MAAVADPTTGVATYDSFDNYGVHGWLVFGGTSVASPLVAGAFALAANHGGPGTLYAHAGELFDVTAGANGTCDGQPAYYCTAGPGYDGPTGLGTPNGVGAF